MNALADILGAFHFLRPWWLLLALAGPAALLLDRARRQEAGGWRGVVAPHLLAALLVTEGRRARLRPAVLAAVLFPLAALALAGPSWRREPNPFVTDRATMVVALDLSRAAQPVLDAGKRKIRDLAALRAGARTGLVAYAGTAHRVLPPTDDARLMETYLAALIPDVMPRDGAAAAAALGVATAMLDAEPGAGTVVFVTPSVPATEAAAFSAAVRATRHGVLLLATGGGPFDGASGASVVTPTPDTADVTAIAARAQRHFALAPSDDPTMRWRDAGPWLALLLVPVAAVFARRGFLAAVLIAMVLAGRPAGRQRAGLTGSGAFGSPRTSMRRCCSTAASRRALRRCSRTRCDVVRRSTRPGTTKGPPRLSPRRRRGRRLQPRQCPDDATAGLERSHPGL